MVLAKILILFSFFVFRQNKARNSVLLTFLKKKIASLDHKNIDLGKSQNMHFTLGALRG